MVEFTKINGESILINPLQIEYVELIPESKIIMMNGRYHIVSEGKEDIIKKVIGCKKEICNEGTLEV